MTTNQTNGLGGGDGFDGRDDGGSRIIQGARLKFTNQGVWETNNDGVIDSSREFLAVGMLRCVQKWISNRPVETRVLEPDEEFPDLDELNATAPPEEWTEKFGRKVGPWQRCWVVYLIDPKTMQAYSYPTDTVGGHQAVRDLRRATQLARRMQPNVYARVCLADAFMPTQYGGRKRPSFNILGFEKLGDEPSMLPPASAAPKQIEAQPQPVEAQPARAPIAAPPKPAVAVPAAAAPPLEKKPAAASEKRPAQRPAQKSRI